MKAIERRGAPLLMGVDAGTTRIRALVFEPDGTLVAEGDAPTPTDHPRPGWAEHDPARLWAAAAGAIRAAVDGTAEPDRIVGVSAASVGEGAFPVAADGRATRAGLAWFDTRPQAETAALAARFGADALFQRTGIIPDPTLGAPKLMWLAAHEPEALAGARWWLVLSAYLAWKLCGAAAADYSLATRTMALDLKRRRWDVALLRDIGVDPALLPPLRPCGARLGRVGAEAAAATGLPRHCAVGVGGHDHIVGAMAAGAWRPGTLLDSLGTAEAVLAAVDAPIADKRLGQRGYSQGAMVVDKPLYYVVGANATSGASVEWLHTLVGADIPIEALNAEAQQVPPGSLGAFFLPQLRIGAPPNPDPDARGALIGLRAETHRGVAYRAVLEGLAYECQSVIDGLSDLDGAPAFERVLAIGGQTRNRLLMRIKAALLGRPIQIVDMVEATSLGAALLGGLAAGVFGSLDDALAGLAVKTETITPDPELGAFYRAAYADVFKRIYPALRPLRAGRGPAR